MIVSAICMLGFFTSFSFVGPSDAEVSLVAATGGTEDGVWAFSVFGTFGVEAEISTLGLRLNEILSFASTGVVVGSGGGDICDMLAACAASNL